jgi:hypothetical protein
VVGRGAEIRFTTRGFSAARAFACAPFDFVADLASTFFFDSI